MQMTDGVTFEFGEILNATQQLKSDLRDILAHSEDTNVASLVREVDETRLIGASNDAPPLTIAFIGQYDSGKSTILRVLTGRSDIVIDSDVCTDMVTAYDWNGVRLLDTPGIHALYPDHDEKTYDTISRADLLVFVITNELFDDVIGRHFRELVFDRQHAGRMLLVVNKMGQDSGSPETKRADIERVTYPYKLEYFRTVFIDAHSWLEAQNSSPEDKAELLEIANIPSLISALNEFIEERGLIGRLSTPLLSLRGIAEQGHAFLSTDFTEERAALELLRRKRSIFLTSRSRVSLVMTGIVANAVSDISKYGDEVAEAIEPGKKEKELDTLHSSAQRRAERRSEELSEEARKCIEDELTELRKQLKALHDGVLATELRDQLEATVPGNSHLLSGEFGSPSWNAQSREQVIAEWPAKAKKVGDIANNIGEWAAKWTTGPNAGGAATGSSTAARGSQAQKTVYNVGKFFGAKFKPWGAVKIARIIGNVGRVLSAIGGILAVVAQIAEDRQQEQYGIQLRNACDEVRSAYRESALSVESAFSAHFKAFIADFYDTEIAMIEEMIEDLTGKRSERSTEAKAFADLNIRARNLLYRVQKDVKLEG
jgi:hypothetical protein